MLTCEEVCSGERGHMLGGGDGGAQLPWEVASWEPPPAMAATVGQFTWRHGRISRITG